MSVVMASPIVSPQTPTSQAELVTVENYNRAQTDALLQLIPARLLRLGHPLQSGQPEIVAAMHQGLVALT